MILVGAQRGHGKKLADHLLNDRDNDHVEVHEVSGFVSDDLTGAFKEVQAIAKGTRCTQPFFCVSLNPPADAAVTVEMFEAAADRIAVAQGLVGQPRAMVFHEKDGRRHAHVVWSRIGAATMTAKNLPYFKSKLQAISRDLFVEHQWKMPQGLRDRSLTSPTNVTLAEWQAAKRRGKNAIDQKRLIQQCWAVSDSRASFEAALKDHGYLLAQGDRRGHVVVCHDGEVLPVARATGLKAKAVRARLGEPEGLLSVEKAMGQHRRDVRGQFVRMAGEARQSFAERRCRLDARRAEMIARHRDERALLDASLAKRWAEESEARSARFRRGVRGLWDRLTGRRATIAEENSRSAYAALQRDRAQRQRLIEAQLEDRRSLEVERTTHRQQAFGLIDEMRSDRDRLIAKLSVPQSSHPRRSRRQSRLSQDRGIDFGPEA